MLHSQRLFTDCQSSQVQRLGLRRPASGVSDLAKVVEAGGKARMVRPEFFENRVGTPYFAVDEPRPCATVNGPSTTLSESMSNTYPRGVVLGRP